MVDDIGVSQIRFLVPINVNEEALSEIFKMCTLQSHRLYFTIT